MSELTVNTDVGATLYDAPREVTQAEKDAFLSKANGLPCKTCGADKVICSGVDCSDCSRDVEIMKAGLSRLVEDLPTSLSMWQVESERLILEYQEKVALRKSQVARRKPKRVKEERDKPPAPMSASAPLATRRKAVSKILKAGVKGGISSAVQAIEEERG